MYLSLNLLKKQKYIWIKINSQVKETLQILYMDKQAFKQRMQNLKSYRENNPSKGYWEWRAQAFIDGGISEYTDDRTDHPIQQKVELDRYLNLANYIDKVNHTDGEGYYNPFYNKADDSYGTVPLDQVTVTAPLTQKAKNNIDARRGAKYVQEGMHEGAKLVAPVIAGAALPAIASAGGLGISTDIATVMIDPLNPISYTGLLGRTVKGVKNIYDSGTVYDRYTTLGGRFGYYGSAPERLYGTIARRLGLPDKPRLPESIRKLKTDITYADGKLSATGHKGTNNTYHTNFTLDRPVVSHSKGNWDGADTYIFDTNAILSQTPVENIKSIEPSDFFINGNEILLPTNKATVISGNIETLNKAKNYGIDILSSPRLRRLYNEALIRNQNTPKLFRKSVTSDLGLDYANEIQRLQQQRGTPFLKDFQLLENRTGLKSGVTDISELSNFNAWGNAARSAAISEISSGKILPYTYPNSRTVDWSKIKEEERLVNKSKYNRVFYDPASHVEDDWKKIQGFQDGGEVNKFQRKTRRDIMQESLVDGRPNYDKMFQNQNEYQKDFANYWYTERAKNPKYSDQIGGDKLNTVLSNVSRATWKTPTEAMRDNMVGQGYNPTDAQINQQLNILKEKGTKGFANPKAHSYTSLRPANTWHEGVGHMVGDNTPAILNATPNVRISNSDSSYEDYVNQANEKHAQTWDFRGNNSNLKDDQGNYYIDPNRQLTPEDISNMRSKGAKIPEQWESLEDADISELTNTFAYNMYQDPVQYMANGGEVGDPNDEFTKAVNTKLGRTPDGRPLQQGLKPVFDLEDAANLTPVGDVLSAKEAYNAARNNDWVGVGLAAATMIPFVPRATNAIRRNIPTVKDYRNSLSNALDRSIRLGEKERRMSTRLNNETYETVQRLMDDPSYMRRAQQVKEKYGDDYTQIYADLIDAYNNSPELLPKAKRTAFEDNARARMATTTESTKRQSYRSKYR